MTDNNPGRKKMISSYLTTSEKTTRIHETQMYLEGEEGSVISYLYMKWSFHYPLWTWIINKSIFPVIQKNVVIWVVNIWEKSAHKQALCLQMRLYFPYLPLSASDTIEMFLYIPGGWRMSVLAVKAQVDLVCQLHVPSRETSQEQNPQPLCLHFCLYSIIY